MTYATIFVDESGDLGWKFDAPYRAGGSSRHLTIAAAVVPTDLSHMPGRVVRDLYKDRRWTTKSERKWNEMSDSARMDFAQRAAALVEQHEQIKLFAMTVLKQRVMPHLRQDPNLLYNYMMKLMLCDEMAKHEQVTLVPDPRSIKVASGNSQHEYLQISLWYEKGAKTRLQSKPIDSSKELGIQFVDMLSGVVQSHHEDSRSDPWKAVAGGVLWKRLFF
jgi:hypothetical protein